jgi:hypothetical protein
MRQSIVTGCLLAGVLGTGALPAQAAGPPKLNAAIPFKFTAGDKEFPKGKCNFDMSMSNKVSIRCSRASSLVQASRLEFLGDPTKDPPRHEMIFHRYGKEYFLSEVWVGFHGREVVKSKAEEELQKNGVTAASIKLTVKK